MKWDRDGYPTEIDCWHQEKRRILVKSKPIDMHCKAKQCSGNEFSKQRKGGGVSCKEPWPVNRES